MPGDVLHADVATMNYIRSEYAFNDARNRGRLELLKGLIARRNSYLLPFHRVTGSLCQAPAVYRGLQDIPLVDIVGSVGREKEFTRRFYPLTTLERQKQRWRDSYTMTSNGIGYPPIEVCKVGGAYFVVNGHHRVSVASYLKWRTIQAHVSELPPSAELQARSDALAREQGLQRCR
jgi:hypothetical protein